MTRACRKVGLPFAGAVGINDGYEFCQEVVTDIDGAWSDTNDEMVTVTEDLGIKFLLTSPDRMVTKISQVQILGTVLPSTGPGRYSTKYF